METHIVTLQASGSQKILMLKDIFLILWTLFAYQIVFLSLAYFI